MWIESGALHLLIIDFRLFIENDLPFLVTKFKHLIFVENIVGYTRSFIIDEPCITVEDLWV